MNQLIAPKETQVIAACKEAAEQGHDYAIKALIAGHMLMEHRVSLMTSHGGKSWNDKTKSEDGQFGKWLDKHEIAKTTAYRWMMAAERLGRAALGIPMHKDFSPVIQLESGESFALSQALIAPEKTLPLQARSFRNAVLDFMADHTLQQATQAVVDGESDGKRITLAAGGKKKGGKGGDRKAFDEFAKTKIKHLTTFLGQKLTVNQKAQIVTAFDSALQQWPRWIIEGLAEKCRTELKLSDAQRKDREGLEA